MNTTILLADLELCGQSDLLSSWAPSLSEDTRVVKLFRASAARQENRGNALVNFAFIVSRGHSSVGEAAAYLDDLPRLVRNANRDAAGIFTKSGGVGGPTVRLEQAQATFKARPASGLRTTVEWSVTGSIPAEIL